MKKILFSKRIFILAIVEIFVFLVMGVSAVVDFDSVGLFVGKIVFCVIMILSGLYLMNTGGMIITHDKEKQLFRRKGLFFGLKYTLKENEITKVVTGWFPFFGNVIIFRDDKHPEIKLKYRFDIGSKRAFLCVINNKKNMEWVRTFWDKPIEDIGDLREILFKKKKIQ